MDDNEAPAEGFHSGRWTGDEHMKFVEAIKLYGRDWSKVQNHVQTRSSTQARSHAQKYFQKMSKYNLTDHYPDEGSNDDMNIEDKKEDYAS